jgi:hypothetical protein
MKRFLALLLLSALPAVAEASPRRILDCNMDFATVPEIEISKDDGTGALTYKLLFNGIWQAPIALDQDMWQRKDIKFDWKDEHYHFFSRDNGRSWRYEVYWMHNEQPSTIGGADCAP